MKKLSISVAALCLLSVPAMQGQADPAASSVTNAMPSSDFGFTLPTRLGTLDYAVTGSEMLEWGLGHGVNADSVVSGNVAYLSKGEHDPFSLVYSGGYIFNATRSGSYSSSFQDLAASQVFQTRSWTYVVSDALAFLPGSPTTGLSGVAGVGDVGVLPVQTGLGPAQNILTNYSNRLSNGLSGSATWQAGPSLSMNGSAAWDVIHFTGSTNPGIDSNEYTGSFGPQYRIDARNSVGADVFYAYSRYPAYNNFKMESEGLDVSYSRAWSRRLSTTLKFGPEVAKGQTSSRIPSAVHFSGSASATYATRTTGFNAAYTRGVNTGSGVIYGALSDTVSFGAVRPVNRDWRLGFTADYSKTVSLAKYMGSIPHYNTAFAAVQLSHRLSETLSCYSSYTLLHQSTHNNNGFNAFTGTSNIIGFGITFAPGPLIGGR